VTSVVAVDEIAARLSQAVRHRHRSAAEAGAVLWTADKARLRFEPFAPASLRLRPKGAAAGNGQRAAEGKAWAPAGAAV